MKTRGEWGLTTAAAGVGSVLAVALVASLASVAMKTDGSAQAAPEPTTSADSPMTLGPSGITPLDPGDAEGRQDPQPDPDRASDQEPKATSEETASPRPEVYEIERGDTLAEISLKTGVSVQTLAKVNDIDNVDWIYAGSALVIPVVDADVAAK